MGAERKETRTMMSTKQNQQSVLLPTFGSVAVVFSRALVLRRSFTEKKQKEESFVRSTTGGAPIDPLDDEWPDCVSPSCC